MVQKHSARTLHYDFRLEIDDMLRSWAVPKGPSLDPGVKRLAILTEDHEMHFAQFEGQIPEGQYGAGSVAIWDKGTYQNLREGRVDDTASMEESFRQGRIEVWLEGGLLKGGYKLIRMKKDPRQWLLIRMQG